MIFFHSSGPSEDLKAQNLLEYLLDNSYTPSAVPTSTSSTPAVQNKTSANTASNSSPRSSSPVASGKHMSQKEGNSHWPGSNNIYCFYIKWIQIFYTV